MTTPNDQSASLWKAPPTSKSKNAIQRAVTALLDELAPERVLKRSEELRAPIEQHRTPTGCVLQAEKAAVSVSWFSTSGNDRKLGELRIMVWRGIVSRRGSPRRKEGATVVSEMVVHPIEEASSDRVWRSTDGSEYSTSDLATLCTKLLDEQVAKS
ncbi:MAG TPA: hypothetical protein VK648_07820 [Gemmatimonadaceae bacterium]|nr:hypothetical protein [Gemmatimonadaceae bacterium]